LRASEAAAVCEESEPAVEWRWLAWEGLEEQEGSGLDCLINRGE
jgi:hypothetical protein